MGKYILLLMLLSLSNSPCKAGKKFRNKKKVKALQTNDDDTDDLFFVNPCTGSLSKDEFTEPCPPDLYNLPLEETTPGPTQSPTQSPTRSPTRLPSKSPTLSPTLYPTSYPTVSPTALPTTKAPTTNPTSSPTEKSNIIQCPDSECDLKSTDSKNVIIVKFKYSVETTPDVSDINSYLPTLEEKLLEELAGTLLQCTDSTRNLQKKTELIQNIRHLEQSEIIQDSKITGVCSDPIDTLVTSESCNPELDENNKCFVISGGVTVSVDDTDTSNGIQQKVKDTTKTIMGNDDLLSPKYKEIEKVKFLEEVVNEVQPAPLVSDSKEKGGKEGVIIGSSLAVLASLLLALLIGRKRYSDANKSGNAEPFGLVQFPALSTDSSSSLVAVDSKDLGKHATGHDVHCCKSTTCPKCYVDPKINFVKAPAIDLTNQEENIPELDSPASSQSSSTTTEFY